MAKDIGSHYDEEYFKWQREYGIFGAVANQIKFRGYLDGKYKKVLDFGCGGGYLLAELKSNIEKFGVEINEVARKEAQKNGLSCFRSSSELPSDYFDLAVSDNALEHTASPMNELKEIHRSLKPGGEIVIVVPFDRIQFNPSDHNKHLFSWSPMNLGNILSAAGFDVIESREFRHKWVPYQEKFTRLFGWKAFHLASRVWARVDHSWSQSRAIAIKR